MSRAWLAFGLLVCIGGTPPAADLSHPVPFVYSPPRPVHVADLAAVPREVIEGARAVLVSRVGERFAAISLSLDSTACIHVSAYEPDSMLVARMSPRSRAMLPPEEAHWTLTYRLRMPEKPYVRGTVTVDVDSTGRAVGNRGVVGIGECADHPEECRFPIDSAAAVAIARRGGIEAGLEPWRVRFGWVAYPTPRYGWVIDNTTSGTQNQGEGQSWIIDANSGEIVARHMWTAIEDRW